MDIATTRDEQPSVVWLANEAECYACLAPATHEIQHGNVWLNVCDDPACRGVGE